MGQVDMDMPAEIGRAVAELAAAAFARRGEPATLDLTSAPTAPTHKVSGAPAGRRTK